MRLLATTTVKRTSEVYQYEYLTSRRADMVFSGVCERTRYFSSKWNRFYSTCKPGLICGGRGYLGPPAGLWVLWIEIPRMGRQCKLDSHKRLRQSEQNEFQSCRMQEWMKYFEYEWMNGRQEQWFNSVTQDDMDCHQSCGCSYCYLSCILSDFLFTESCHMLAWLCAFKGVTYTAVCQNRNAQGRFRNIIPIWKRTCVP